jgi:HSP20 family molecular chaperone IbpA
MRLPVTHRSQPSNSHNVESLSSSSEGKRPRSDSMREGVKKKLPVPYDPRRGTASYQGQQVAGMRDHSSVRPSRSAVPSAPSPSSLPFLQGNYTSHIDDPSVFSFMNEYENEAEHAMNTDARECACISYECSSPCDCDDSRMTSGQPSPIPTDIAETVDSFTFHFTLPGFHRRDLDLRIIENDGTSRLIVTGRKPPLVSSEFGISEDGDIFHRVESSSGTFLRTVVLPDSADVDYHDFQAVLKDGVLGVRVPKKTHTPFPPRIIAITDGF